MTKEEAKQLLMDAASEMQDLFDKYRKKNIRFGRDYIPIFLDTKDNRYILKWPLDLLPPSIEEKYIDVAGEK